MKRDDVFLQYEKKVAEFKLDLIKKLSSDSTFAVNPRKKRTSNISKVEAVLKKAGQPLHITDIIASVEETFGVVLDRDSLSSAIIKQVRKEKLFMRVAPNTFALRDV